MRRNAIKELYMIGTGGFCREALDTVHAINEVNPTYTVAGFIDEDESRKGELIGGIEIIGPLDQFREKYKTQKVSAVIAIANPKVKEEIANILDGIVSWETLIHPTAYVSAGADIGEGSIVQEFCSIKSGVTLGRHCTVNCTVVVGHETKIGDYSSLMPLSGVMGSCVLSERVYIGAGAITNQGVTIGSDATVGSGCIVIRDVETGATMVGNPARRIK